jgi:hypothetical protein
MAVLPANWPATGGNFNGNNMNNVENAVNAIPAKIVATVVATTPLPAGVYVNAGAGVGATFTVTATGTTTVDGHVLALNDVVLLAGQASAVQNGPYLVTVAGGTGVSTVLTRATVMNSSADFPGSMVIASGAGASYPNTVWLCTATGAPVIGTTNLPFVQPRRGKRVTADSSSPATLTLNTDTFDTYQLTGLANATTISASGGNPFNRSEFELIITDNGTSQPLTWIGFLVMGIVGSLPPATQPGREMTFRFIYNSGRSAYVCAAADVVGY